MSTLLSVYAIGFGVGEIFGEANVQESDIVGIMGTIGQGMINRGLKPIAMGLTDGKQIVMVFNRSDQAGAALKHLQAILEIIGMEREVLKDDPEDLRWLS